MRNWVKGDLQEGIRQGVFRSDLPLELMAGLRMKTIELGFDLQAMSRGPVSIGEIQQLLLDHFLRGIMTQQGLQQYEQLQSQDSL